MKLIADSGSTKTSWRFIAANDNIITIHTSGINPFFRTSEDIERELRVNLLPYTDEVHEIYFYGAGIINNEKAAVVVHALKQIYGDILIEAQSDVVGAARSVSGDEPGIVCILGTGANACFYDGEELVDGIPPMGFILGDEGSGAVMGKNLLGDYFKRIMPEALRAKFEQQYQIRKETILERVYRQEKPNQFLAEFTPFLSENSEDEYCREFICRNLNAFVQRNIKMLPDSVKLPIHFVGTVAYVFQDYLKDLLSAEDLEIGKVIKEPIDGLVFFHQKK